MMLATLTVVGNIDVGFDSMCCEFMLCHLVLMPNWIESSVWSVYSTLLLVVDTRVLMWNRRAYGAES